VLRARDATDIGKIERHRGTAENKPVIAGTRIPVKSIKAFSDAGYSKRTSAPRYPTGSAQLRLRVLLDEGVPVAVGTVFVNHGHTLIPFDDVLLRGSSDDLVCKAAEANDALLVAFDNDMKQMARRHGTTPARFRGLNLLKFECEETKGR